MKVLFYFGKTIQKVPKGSHKGSVRVNVILKFAFFDLIFENWAESVGIYWVYDEVLDIGQKD